MVLLGFSEYLACPVGKSKLSCRKAVGCVRGRGFASPLDEKCTLATQIALVSSLTPYVFFIVIPVVGQGQLLSD